MKTQVLIDNNLFRKITQSSDSSKLKLFTESLEKITAGYIDMPAPGLFEFLGFKYPSLKVGNFEEYKKSLNQKVVKKEDFSGVLAELHQELEELLSANPDYKCSVAIKNYKNQIGRMNPFARNEYESFLNSRIVKENRFYILKDLATEMMLGFNWGTNDINEKVIISFIASHFSAKEKEIEFSSRYFFKIWKYLKLRLKYEEFNLYENNKIFQGLLAEIEDIVHLSDAKDYYDSKALLWLIEGYSNEKAKVIFATSDPFESVLFRIALIKFIHYSTYCWVYSTDKYSDRAILYGMAMVFDQAGELKHVIDVDKVPSLYTYLKQGLLTKTIIEDAHDKFDI